MTDLVKNQPGPSTIVKNTNLWPTSFTIPEKQTRVCIRTFIFKDSTNVQKFLDFLKENFPNRNVDVKQLDNGNVSVSISSSQNNNNESNTQNKKYLNEIQNNINLNNTQTFVYEQTNNYLNNQIIYYNTNNANISAGVSTWQGMARYLNSKIIICGTTKPSPTTGMGLVYIGNIEANSPNQTNYTFLVPGSVFTSAYGPRYDPKTNEFTIVGSYNNSEGGDNLGFLYRGPIDELNNSDNYITRMQPIPNKYTDTFVHSTDGNFAVGASGSRSTIDLYEQAWIYNISESNYFVYTFEGSVFTTIYGIVINEDGSYTICGGYTPSDQPLKQIGFITDFTYNSDGSYSFFNSSPISEILGYKLLHFEGLSKTKDSDVYTIVGDGLGIGEETIGLSAVLKRKNGSFSVLKAVNINYEQLSGSTKGITTSNSVLDNDIVGYFKGNEDINSSFQAKINWENVPVETN